MENSLRSRKFSFVFFDVDEVVALFLRVCVCFFCWLLPFHQKSCTGQNFLLLCVLYTYVMYCIAYDVWLQKAQNIQDGRQAGTQLCKHLCNNNMFYTVAEFLLENSVVGQVIKWICGNCLICEYFLTCFIFTGTYLISSD